MMVMMMMMMMMMTTLEIEMMSSRVGVARSIGGQGVVVIGKSEGLVSASQKSCEVV